MLLQQHFREKKDQQGDQERLPELAAMAAQAGVRTVVTNDVLFHVPARRLLQDVVTCIRHGCTIEEAGYRAGELRLLTSILATSARCG